MRKRTYNAVRKHNLQAKRRSFLSLLSWFVVANTIFGNVAHIQHDRLRRGL